VSRPRLRDAFLRLERGLVVHFYTTSSAKFAQAQEAFQHAGLSVTEFRSAEEPYRENEQGTSKELLRAAIDEIKRTIGPAATSLFFVEDTSLRIEALSTPHQDYPGLRVKQWFAETSFADLDTRLRERGNDRRATVKSDIALHVPNLQQPILFHGETSGHVADVAPTFDENSAHPWLTPDTFNGWFIPDGADKVLGAMSLEEATRHDFRGRALEQLLDRLEEYAAAANFPSHVLARRRDRRQAEALRLFQDEGPMFIVVGPACAGKTTFGNHASRPLQPDEQRTSVQHIEASDVVRTFNGGPREGESALAFAQRVLGLHGPDVAARRIVDEYFGEELQAGFVITGFRTIQEVLYVKQKFWRTRVLFVDAPLRVRYDRLRARARSNETMALEEFRQQDEDQAALGLLDVADQIADLHFRNDQNLKSYLRAVDALVSGGGTESSSMIKATSSKSRADRNQLARCLTALAQAGRPLSTDEVEAATGILHNNANKTLKRYPALARRLETGTGRLRYDVTDAGRAFVTYMRNYFASEALGEVSEIRVRESDSEDSTGAAASSWRPTAS
jgi:inosine/xanthosine triphosphate pyrophosphatase family protein/ribose 1,5-bisphosphokinase PhnN